MAGWILKFMPKTYFVEKRIDSEKRLRFSQAGLLSFYKDDEARRRRNFEAEREQCQLWLDRGDTYFDLYCEEYEVGGTTIREEIKTPYDPVIDVFPFEIPGLIAKETGEVHMSDLLIFAGILGIAGPAVVSYLKP